MAEVVLTTNVALNGGTVNVYVNEYDYNGTQINRSGTNLSNGWNSYTLTGFRGQNGSNDYAVELFLSHSDATQSPVVHQATVEAPNTGASVYVNVNDSWEKRPVYFHNGTSWQRANDLKYYDGSEWV